MKTFRNLIMLLGCWLVAYGALAQAPPILTVVLVDQNSQPVSGRQVNVWTDSSAGVFFTDQGLTNPNGVFESNLISANLSSPTLFYMSTAGCNGAWLWDTLTMAPGQSRSITLTTCTSGGGGNCGAGFQSVPDSSGGPFSFSFFSSASGQAPYAYRWDFGDGDSSSQANPSHSYAQQGAYKVCLIITDANGCMASFCDSVGGGGSAPQRGSISGFAMLSGGQVSNDDRMVYLIGSYVDSINGGTVLYAIDSLTIVAPDSGYFQFSNLPYGTYYIKTALLPSAPNFAAHLPTYYNSELRWAQATAIVLSASNPNPFISYNLVAGNNPGGPGFIGGNVTQGANKMAGTGDPVANIPVMLVGHTNGVKAYTMTDASGNFSLNNLPLGTYTVMADMINRFTNDLTITLTAAAPSANGLSIEVNAQPTGIADQPTPITADALFPNPATSTASLSLSLQAATRVEVRILNLAGQTVATQTQDLPVGSSTLTLDVQALPAGLYLVQVGGSTLKLVKN